MRSLSFQSGPVKEADELARLCTARWRGSTSGDVRGRRGWGVGGLIFKWYWLNASEKILHLPHPDCLRTTVIFPVEWKQTRVSCAPSSRALRKRTPQPPSQLRKGNTHPRQARVYTRAKDKMTEPWTGAREAERTTTQSAGTLVRFEETDCQENVRDVPRYDTPLSTDGLPEGRFAMDPSPK